MRFNIRTKLFILLAGLTAVILAGVLFALTRLTSDNIENKVVSDFKQTQTFFQKQQSLIYDRLVESCFLIGQNSTFKANVELRDPASVYQSIEEFADFAKTDLFIVTDRTGTVLAWLDDTSRTGRDMTHRERVVMALSGVEPDLTITWPRLWEVDSRLYQVVTVPIFAAGSIIGTISLGSQITQFEARDLKGSSSIDISLFLNDQLIGTSLGDSLSFADQSNFETFIQRHKEAVDTVIQAGAASDAFSAQLGAEPVFAFVSPLGVGENAYYLATVPKSVVLGLVETLRRNIFLIAGISLITTMILALVLGRKVSQPVLRLAEGMNKVKEGDLSIKIPPSTKDEIGTLTETFNNMIGGLQERLQLIKYVGSHTREMIKKAMGEEVGLGGTRKKLAVLFSDIRGFTAFSENRTPEEVIAMLNRYLGFQADFVDQYGGSVDKFVGDEMVAIFVGEDAIERAIECSIQIQKQVRKEHETDDTPIEIGIGINYGSMIMGNMGAKQRMDYTVLGANVNLGARLCQSAAGGTILVRKDLLALLNKDFKIGQVHQMSFKGFSNEIEIAEVLCE